MRCRADREGVEAAGKPVKGWSDDVEDEEAEAAYNCIKAKLAAAYGKSDEEGAKDYQAWKRYNVTAYPSGTHGNRFVNNFANDVGNAYGKYEGRARCRWHRAHEQLRREQEGPGPARAAVQHDQDGERLQREVR